ncbi:hypothetical protein V8C86DRAFT_602098 [Haematococcus lacustris]
MWLQVIRQAVSWHWPVGQLASMAAAPLAAACVTQPGSFGQPEGKAEAKQPIILRSCASHINSSPYQGQYPTLLANPCLRMNFAIHRQTWTCRPSSCACDARPLAAQRCNPRVHHHLLHEPCSVVPATSCGQSHNRPRAGLTPTH